MGEKAKWLVNQYQIKLENAQETVGSIPQYETVYSLVNNWITESKIFEGINHEILKCERNNGKSYMLINSFPNHTHQWGVMLRRIRTLLSLPYERSRAGVFIFPFNGNITIELLRSSNVAPKN